MAAQMIAVATVIAGLAGLVTASGHLSSLSALDASQVRAGELWRLFSGHLAHLSWRHYWVDAPVFIALYATYGRRTDRASALLLLLLAALTVSLTVLVADIHQVYGGLSGLSCAAVSAILLLLVLERPRQLFPYLMSAMYCCYLLFMGGASSGVPVAHEAHLAGSVAGVVFVLIKALRASGHFSYSFPSSSLGTHPRHRGSSLRPPMALFPVACDEAGASAGELRSQAGAWERGHFHRKKPCNDT
jgi:rhomboid family GlyGly-CTERM serine protease